MARRSSYLLALLLACFVIGVAGLATWLLTTGEGGEVISAPRDGAAPASPPSPTELSTPTRAAGANELVATAPELAPRETTEERTDAVDAGLDDAFWIEGRVQFPAGMPLGEAVVLEAKGRAFEQRDLHRTRPLADGSFRAAFSPKTRTGWLVLHAEHLYLDKPFRLKPAAPPADLVLEARLGGRIQGRVLADLAPDDRALLVGAEVSLEGEPDADLILDDFELERTAKLEQDLAFSFGGLPPGFIYRIELDSRVLTRTTVRDLTIEPGETTHVDLEPTLGVRVAGRVVDEQGQPVPDVELRAFSSAEDAGERWRRYDDLVELDEQGRFVERGVLPGHLSLTVKSPAHIGRRVDLGELSDGQRVDDVELVLSHGQVLSGVVQWPDGEPVSEASVVLAQSPASEDEQPPFPIWAGFSHEHERELETGADGTFHFAGLHPTPAELSVSAVVPDEKGRRKRSGPSWNVTLEVTPGTEGLVVTLTAGIVLTGRVTDDLGMAIDDFAIQVMPKAGGFRLGGPRWFDEDQGLASRFRGAGGFFAMEGLEGGRWQVRAVADGYLTCAPVELELPGDSAGLALVLDRAPLLSGHVVDATGNPVEGASVVAIDARASGWERVFEKHSARAREGGAFQLKHSPVGIVELQAWSNRHAPSEVLTLDLEPGEVESGIALVLREGGRITGTLVSLDGDTVAGRMISLGGEELGPQGRRTRTDAEGAFGFEGLPPGDFVLAAQPSRGRVQQLAVDGRSEWKVRQSARLYADVTIVGSETVSVVLGAAPENPVHVTGLVSSGGEGVDDVDITVTRAGASRSKMTVSDAAGRYVVTLDEPGEYTFNLSHGGVRLAIRETVPDVDQHTLDLELPASSVTGRVLGPDGQPVERMTVQLAATRETAESRSFGVSGWSATDAAGSFAFEGVAPGDYLISAGRPPWWDTSEEEEYGSAQVEVTVTAGEESGGIELQLDEGAFITGVVRDDKGRPVTGAAVFVRSVRGAVISHWPTETDGAGRFRTQALNGGEWTVSARSGAHASPESRPVHLSQGGTEQVELVLGPATMLVVHVRDGAGGPVGAGLTVTDGGGREFAGLRSYSDVAIYEGYDELAIVVGPLPPGSYEVVASNHGGAQAEHSVELSGEAERELQLVLSSEK